MHAIRIRLIGAGCIAILVAIALMFLWQMAETTDVPTDEAITHRVLTQGYIEDAVSGDPLAEVTLSFYRQRNSRQELVSLTSNGDGWFDAIRVGSKNSAELEVVLSTAVAAVWVSTFQLLDFTHCSSESGRFSCPEPSSPCNSCSSPATFCLPPSETDRSLVPGDTVTAILKHDIGRVHG